MDAREKIASLIFEKGEITVPEIQVALSLPYKTVREALSDLTEKGCVTYEGEMTFRAKGNAPTKRELTSRRSAERSRLLRKIAEEAQEDTNFREMIRYAACNPDETITMSLIQTVLQVGFASAYLLRGKLTDLKVLSSRGSFRLTRSEAKEVLGAIEEAPPEGSPADLSGSAKTEEIGEQDADSDNIIAEMLHSARFGMGEKVRFKGPKEDPDEDDFPFEIEEESDYSEEYERWNRSRERLDLFFPFDDDDPLDDEEEDDGCDSVERSFFETFDSEEDGEHAPIEEKDAGIIAAKERLMARLEELRARMGVADESEDGGGGDAEEAHDSTADPIDETSDADNSKKKKKKRKP